jgi:selenocysteine-specific elongation factor
VGPVEPFGRRPVVIGTAGHVDHGKTTLVKALTGVDTDRLPEEKAREITIEIGFAPLTLPDGTTCSVVDVPGHERFIKNMLAGATGVDIVLLVVDAREGVREQTREHLEILDLLGVRAGVAALTKIDTIPREAVTPAVAALAGYLRGTVLAGCPVVPVSARTGEGVDLLLAALAQAVGPPPSPAPEPGPARLAIDRAFGISGFGQVVTGTVAGGVIAEGRRLQVYPAGPIVRVRRLEVHGHRVSRVGIGERAALNVVGDSKGLSLRGLVLADPGTLEPATCLGLSLRLLPDAGVLKDLERVRFHAGTAETLGRIILLHEGQRELQPAPSPARVVFQAEVPLAVATGQAFVIRRYSPPRTIGGGTIAIACLDRLIANRPRGRAARRSIAGLLAAGDVAGGPVRPPVPGGVGPLAAYMKRLGLAPEPVRTRLGSAPGAPLGDAPPPLLPPGVKLLAGGQQVAEETFYQAVCSELVEDLRARHLRRPHLAMVGREELWSRLAGRGLSPAVWLETMAIDGIIVLAEGKVRLGTWRPVRPEPLVEAMDVLEEALRRGGFSPPPAAEVGAGLPDGLALTALACLLENGTLVAPLGEAGAFAGGPVFHRQAVGEARRLLEEHLDLHGEVSVAGFRDKLGSSRKFVLPLLEHFDREKVTYRSGDLRIRRPSGSGADQGGRRTQ